MDRLRFYGYLLTMSTNDPGMDIHGISGVQGTAIIPASAAGRREGPHLAVIKDWWRLEE